MAIVYLNGDFIDANQASISVFDRGFLFGDSVYEVISLYQSSPDSIEPACRHFLALDKHLERLKRNLSEIGIEIPDALSIERFTTIADQLIRRNRPASTDVTFYLQVTRGTQMPRSYKIPPDIKPTLLITCSVSARKTREAIVGLSAITVTENRWKNAHIKSNSLLANVMAVQQAQQAKVDEAIYVSDGDVRECSSGNLFICKKNKNNDIVITTPPTESGIVDGVTRDVILKIAELNHYNTRIETSRIEELYTAEEIWVTGATKELQPITTVDGKLIGAGKVSANNQALKQSIWRDIWELYAACRKKGAVVKPSSGS